MKLYSDTLLNISLVLKEQILRKKAISIKIKKFSNWSETCGLFACSFFSVEAFSG